MKLFNAIKRELCDEAFLSGLVVCGVVLGAILGLFLGTMFALSHTYSTIFNILQ